MDWVLPAKFAVFAPTDEADGEEHHCIPVDDEEKIFQKHVFDISCHCHPERDEDHPNVLVHNTVH